MLIFYENKCTNVKNISRNPFYVYDKIYDINFIPIAGGTYDNKKIKSFWVTESCISNYQYSEFIRRNGYSIKKYWSKDGYNWLISNDMKKPKTWEYFNDKWYINNIPLDQIYNFPIEKITYYEAEAFANFYNCRLPTEEEWKWMATNRNKTIYPNGIKLPLFFELSSNFSSIEGVNSPGCKSLMGLYQLYGNVWEYTNTLRINDTIEVCVKGGDRNIPIFLLNDKLKMYIERDTEYYNVGFRMIKNNY